MENVETKESHKRRRRWILPLVCLAVFAILLVGCCGGIFRILTGTIRSSEPYRGALARVRGSPTVREILGTPIRAGFLARGSIRTRGKRSRATFDIPISGPRGRAMLHVVAERSGKVWTFKTLAVEVERTGDWIDLLVEP